MDLNSKAVNNTSSNLPKETRFKPWPLYSKQTGQTCFMGPGSYNVMESFNLQNRTVCTAKMVSVGDLVKCFVEEACRRCEGRGDGEGKLHHD